MHHRRHHLFCGKHIPPLPPPVTSNSSSSHSTRLPVPSTVSQLRPKVFLPALLSSSQRSWEHDRHRIKISSLEEAAKAGVTAAPQRPRYGMICADHVWPFSSGPSNLSPFHIGRPAARARARGEHTRHWNTLSLIFLWAVKRGGGGEKGGGRKEKENQEGARFTTESSSKETRKRWNEFERSYFPAKKRRLE